MPKDFKQYDSRWGKKSYAGGTMSGCGCGPTSLADIVYDIDSTITPVKVADWLTKNGYAGTKGRGTIRWGITHALKHYGFTDVKGVTSQSDDKTGKNDPSMAEFCKLMVTGEYRGIILFMKGTKGGITWTSSGHYMACYGATKSGSDYILSMYDSGQRGHSGKYSYNKTMKGLCYRAYIGKLPKKPVVEPKGYTGTFPTLSTTVTDNSECIDNVVAYAKKIAADNTYKYKKWTSNPNTHKCPICYPKSGKGANCIGLVGLSLRHGGNIPVKCACNGIGDNAFFDKLTLASWKKRNGSDWIEVSTAQKGDVVICYNKSTDKYVHVALHAGNSQIVDATSSLGINVRAYSNLNKYKKRIFRYTGQQKTRTVTTVLKNGSKSADVGEWQGFLNWYFEKQVCKEDNAFGNVTANYTALFQEQTMGKSEVDSKVGSKTLAAAKAVKK